MCRHLAYLGPPVSLASLVTEPARGLYEQSWAPRRQRHGTVNADGFGLGWYPQRGPAQGPDGDGAAPPARYRRAVPIWADPNLPDLARALHSTAVVAAVRDATAGTAQDETAAAPYANGPWLFSHNGAVPDWQRLPDDLGIRLDAATLLGLESRCDSALLWALLHARLVAGEPPGEALAHLTRRVRAVRPGARLNFLLSDGHTVAATRCGDTLFHRSGPGSVLVASEPDAADGWREVRADSVLLATRSDITVTSLALPTERNAAV
ncbi:ergothioneine biosynthesis protein EgtC [Streptomyces sp. NPDC054796]